MKGLFSKVVSKIKTAVTKNDVEEFVDAAFAVEKGEDKLLDALLIVYGNLRETYLAEMQPTIRDEVKEIYEAGRAPTLRMNETYSQRKLKNDMDKLRIHREAFKKVEAHNKSLEEKMKDSEAKCEKKKLEFERAGMKGEAEKLKAKALWEGAQRAVETDRKAWLAHNEVLDKERAVYQRKLMDLLTLPLERMLESRLRHVDLMVDTAETMEDASERMEFKAQEEVDRLETHLGQLNKELADIDN